MPDETLPTPMPPTPARRRSRARAAAIAVSPDAETPAVATPPGAAAAAIATSTTHASDMLTIAQQVARSETRLDAHDRRFDAMDTRIGAIDEHLHRQDTVQDAVKSAVDRIEARDAAEIAAKEAARKRAIEEAHRMNARLSWVAGIMVTMVAIPVAVGYIGTMAPAARLNAALVAVLAAGVLFAAGRMALAARRRRL